MKITLDMLLAPRVSIEFLPPELLTIIFTFVYEDIKPLFDAVDCNLSEEDRSSAYPEKSDLIKRSELGLARAKLYHYSWSPICFPYALAGVCQRWKNVLSSSPAFWTRIMLFIDSQPSSIEDASEYLSRTRNLPLDITITRREYLKVHDEQEKKLIQAFFHLLLPHVHRWRSFHVDAASSSSLPILATEFLVKAPLLQSVTLVCDDEEVSDDCTNNVQYEANLNRRTLSMNESLPALRTLVLDGLNFNFAGHDRIFWFSHPSKLEQLTISQYKRNRGLNTVTVRSAFDRIFPLDSIMSLKLVGTQFVVDAEHRRRPNGFYDMDHLEDLSLDMLEPELMSEIFRVCTFGGLHILHLARCSRLESGFLNGLDARLRLLSLDDLPPTVDLPAFVKDNRSRSISVSNCDWLGDDFLESLSQYEEIEQDDDTVNPATVLAFPSRRRFACHDLKMLVLMYCPSLSLDALKKTVEARGFYVDYDDPEWKAKVRFGPAIEFLIVKQCGFGPLSSEDAEWFMKRVPDVTWGV